METSVTLVTKNDEKITFLFDEIGRHRNTGDFGNCFVVGHAFVALVAHEWKAFRITACTVTDYANAQYVRSRIVDGTETSATNTYIYMFFLDDKLKVEKPLDDTAVILLMTNDYNDRRRAVNYVDIVYAKKLDENVLFQVDVEFIAYGTLCDTNCSFATRVVIDIRTCVRYFHYFNKFHKFIITCRGRFDKALPHPGTNALFAKADRLLIFNQFCCIKNVNRALKRIGKAGAVGEIATKKPLLDDYIMPARS